MPEGTSPAPGASFSIQNPEFDAYAARYHAELDRGLKASGESAEYFARARVAWLASRLAELGMRADAVLDFGCGIGQTGPLLLERLHAGRVVGVDVSEESLRLARDRRVSERISYQPIASYAPQSEMDVAYCNGVIHHIPLAERDAALAYVHRALKPGGYFGCWENNPWNPGTRYIMSRVSFDRDAILTSAFELARLLRRAGFEIVRTDFLFIFPRALAWLRWIEPWVARLPLGGQYQVLARKC